jgi:predicted O-methyltransferase YrrM
MPWTYLLSARTGATLLLLLIMPAAALVPRSPLGGNGRAGFGHVICAFPVDASTKHRPLLLRSSIGSRAWHTQPQSHAALRAGPGLDAGDEGEEPADRTGDACHPRRRRRGAWAKARDQGPSGASGLVPSAKEDVSPSATEVASEVASLVAAEFATTEEWARVSDDMLAIFTPSICRPGADSYMRGLSTADESEVLKWIRAETRRRFTPEEASMQIFPEQGKWLSQVAVMLGATKILELGSFTGYSSTCLAAAMPPEGRLLCADVSAVYTSLAREAWQRAGLERKISLHIGTAEDYLAELLAPGQNNEGSFDLIFIDADKEGYLVYYEAAMALVRPGGAICVDDSLWSGRVVAASGAVDAETGAEPVL